MHSKTIITIILTLLVGVANADNALVNRTFSVINAANGLADNSAQTLVTTRSGRMIITTIGHVNFYDGFSFSHVNSDLNETYKLGGYEGNYHTYFDQDHRFWLKDKHKVSCVNLHTEKFISNISGIFKQEGVTGRVDDLFADNSNRLWLVSRGRLFGDKGKYSIPLGKETKLQDLGTRGDSLFLFYENSKIELYNLKTQKLIKTAKTLDGERAAKYAKTTIFKFYKNGFFQLRSGNNISVLTWVDLKTLRSRIIMEKDYFLCNLAIHNNLLYIASSYGYWTYDLETGNTFHRETLMLTNGKELKTDINAIDFDKQGGMWIGTEKRGLLYSKPHTPPFIIYNWHSPEASEYWNLMDTLKRTSGTDENGAKINCVTIDSRKWKWVGLMDGIKVYDTEGNLIKHIKQQNGMLNEVTHSIVEDNFHNMWAGTSNGVVSINIRKGNKIGFVNSFDANDGIPAESFSNGKALKLDDGTIIMQAVDHVLKFNPAQFHTMGKENTPLVAKFVKLMVNGVYVGVDTDINGSKILDNVAAQTKELNLNYNQNFINMTFSALNYFRPHQTYYRYRVVGYDEKWHTASFYDHDGLVDEKGLFHLPLPGLEPGRYVAEIQASMYPNQWNGKVTSIKINVYEPWWQATMTYIIIAIIIMVLIGYNIFCYSTNYKIRLAKRSSEQMEIHQLQTFLQRSEIMAKKPICPNLELMSIETDKYTNEISKEFITLMEKISPLLHKDTSALTTLQLSNAAGLSTEKFHKLVASNIDKSPKQLDLHIRMKRACDLMKANPELTLGEVATMVNYSSVNYFISSFYRQYQITPKQYRNKMTAWRQ